MWFQLCFCGSAAGGQFEKCVMVGPCCSVSDWLRLQIQSHHEVSWEERSGDLRLSSSLLQEVMRWLYLK